MSSPIRLIDVANEAGVSRVAAGHVLLGSGKGSVRVSDDAKKRILEASNKLGYQPNRSAQRLSGATGNLIGAVVGPNAPESERDRLVALEKISRERGYQLLITSGSGGGFKNALESASLLTAQGAAGILFLTAGIRLTGREDNPNLPTHGVYCGIPENIGSAPGVVLDLAHGYRLAIQHFAETGRKRVGVLNVDLGNHRSAFSKHRMNAVNDEANLIGGIEIVPYFTPVEKGSRTITSTVAEELISSAIADKVDAILAHNDTSAARIIQALHNRGLHVPQDVAICGLNNLAISDLTSPPLTTIDERAEDIATAMLEILLERFEAPDAPAAQRTIKPKLIVRQST